MVEFQLGTSTVSGGAPYLIRYAECISGLVETSVDFRIDKSVFVRKFFIIILDRSCVACSSIQCLNFGLPAADVDANLLCEGVKVLCLLLNVHVGV